MVPKKHLWHDPVEATAATAILWDCQNLEPQSSPLLKSWGKAK